VQKPLEPIATLTNAARNGEVIYTLKIWDPADYLDRKPGVYWHVTDVEGTTVPSRAYEIGQVEHVVSYLGMDYWRDSDLRELLMFLAFRCGQRHAVQEDAQKITITFEDDRWFDYFQRHGCHQPPIESYVVEDNADSLLTEDRMHQDQALFFAWRYLREYRSYGAIEHAANFYAVSGQATYLVWLPKEGLQHAHPEAKVLYIHEMD